MEDIQCNLEEVVSRNIACFICFKLISDKKKIDSFGENFCSYNCADNYRNENIRKCENCKIHYKKEQGLYFNGKNFCSEECAPSLEEL